MMVKRNLLQKTPTLLSCFGVIGVVATAVTAVWATPRSIERIQHDSRINHDGDPKAYTKKEAVQSGWRFYIPTVLIGASTIYCILGADAFNKKQQSAIASAYVLVDNAYKRYRDQVTQTLGEDADTQIRDAITKHQFDEKSFSTSEKKQLFHEEYSGEFFESTKVDVLLAEYHFNRNFALRGYANLNEFYEFLGIPTTDYGETVGWSYDAGGEYYGYSWVDFDHRLMKMDDGTECYRIEMPFRPTTDYLGD